VVAAEVRSLANQTARATSEIEEQIGAMQSETGRTVDAISRVSTLIEGLNQTSSLVAEAALQQAAATQEIGRAVVRSAQGTDATSEYASGVSEDAKRTGAAATEVQAASTELAQRTEGLRAQMEQFLVSLRAD
jgi:methyl-accepting chemotaxis protein